MKKDLVSERGLYLNLAGLTALGLLVIAAIKIRAVELDYLIVTVSLKRHKQREKQRNREVNREREIHTESKKERDNERDREQGGEPEK